MRPLKIFLASLGFRKTVLGTIPPLGIMYLAAYLRTKFKIQFRIVNQKLDNLPDVELLKQAKEFDADIVGLSVMTPNAYSLPFITAGLKVALPKSLIVIGGPHVSAYGAKALEGNLADIAVPFEGELTFEKIINAYIDAANIENVPGIFRRDKDRIFSNPGLIPFVEDIDTLPFPAYDLINLKSYWRLPVMNISMRNRYASLFSSRGCPFNCIYCHKIFGNKMRSHSADRVIEEINFYKKQFGVDCFEFEDDIFNLDNKRLFDICERLTSLAAGTGLSFPNGLRVDELNESSIDALADAGTYYCSCPLESGSSRIQKLIEKNLNIPKYVENVKYAASKKIFTLGFVLMGFPTETEEDVKETIKIACSSRLHAASFWTLIPFPKTKVHDMISGIDPESLRSLSYNNNEFPYIQCNFSNMSDETLFYYQRKAHINFYMNPDRIFRLMRDFPQKQRLPLYIPEFFKRLSKGIIS